MSGSNVAAESSPDILANDEASVLNLVIIGQFVRSDSKEAIEVIAKHEHIDIVVPRYEPFVPHRPDQRSESEAVAQIVLAAYRVKTGGHFQHRSLHDGQFAALARPLERRRISFPRQGYLPVFSVIDLKVPMKMLASNFKLAFLT